MKIDAPLLVGNPLDAIEVAKEMEAVGYDGLYTFEGQHDPFFPLAMAAPHTQQVELMTAIAVAFARNPMTLANIGYDMQMISGGRFILGLGTQIKPHIERRFSMQWSKPASRMREMVQAIRAIWASWETGERLDFQGEFYTHTLMAPHFNPGPHPNGLPKIYIAGFGERMVEMVGEVGDGFLVHPLNTPKFLQEYSLPALQRGLEKSGRSAGDCDIAVQCMMAVGETRQEIDEAREMARGQIAFYGSTPAYKPALDAHGWGDELQPQLHRLSREGDWVKMAALIPDEVVEAFAPIGSPAEVAQQIKDRYGDIAARVSPISYARTSIAAKAVLRELKLLI